MRFLFQCLTLLLASLGTLRAGDQPNFIVINIDDLGYADIGPFGSKLNRTPHLDRMAAEGKKLTCFYAAPVCSPSRAALMTGCYPKRVLPIGGVLFPSAAVGLNPAELTVAELLKDAGYATGCIGKWHLGDQPEFLPTRQGFDYYLGIPYSNDMGPAEDGSKSSLGEKLRELKTGNGPKDNEEGIRDGARQPPLPLMENDKVIARVKQDEQQGIVQRYTEAAVKFIQTHQQKPFFLYLPHTAVHGPHYPGKQFAGKSPHGIYHDWVEEVDWSVGQVLDALRASKLDQKTLVLFTSDNGGTTNGLNTPLRGGKTTTWEGGMRVPTIAWWPGKIPAATSTDAVTGMFDVLPTLVKLAGGKLPSERKIDGGNIWPLLAGEPGAKSPHEVFYYYRGMKLECVRSGPWKLRLASAAETTLKTEGAPRTKVKPGVDQLFNLESDVGESKNVAADNPEVLRRLLALADATKDDLGLNDSGPGLRPLGRVGNPQPILNQEDHVRDGLTDARGGMPVKTSAVAEAKTTPHLNVLFIIADDLRPDLGCYGAKHIQSPNIDKLAARGTLFERAYCQVSVCNPSRSSLLGGVRPDTTGVLDNQHFLRSQLPDIITLPQYFKNNGWHSMSLGKIFHHSEREPGDDPQSWSEPSWYHGVPDRSWFSKETDEKLKAIKKLPSDKRPKLVRGPPFEAADEPDDFYGDAQTAIKAIETLQRLIGIEKPFFLGVGFHKPHLPFTCPQKYWDLYPADTIKLPDNYQASPDVPAPALHNWYELRSYGDVPAEGGIPDEMALSLIRGYRACTSFVDAQIGRVLDELDRLGLRENTIIVLLGDHGYHLGENGIFTKMTNFELGTHAPLIVCAPGQKPGQRSRALVEFVDIYPTLAELCGLKLPSHLEGTSFVPLLADPRQKGKRAAFSQYLRPGKEKFMGRSVRTDRWRYTEWKNMKDEVVGTELYDERTDPKENHNLAADSANAETVAAMAKQLHDGPKQKPASAGKSYAPKQPAVEEPKKAAAAKASSAILIGNFEGKDLAGWTTNGTAFATVPVQPGDRFTAFEGTGIEWSGEEGPRSTGTLSSPIFKLERSFINYLVAGARDLPSRLGVELLVDGKVVRAASATEIKDPTKAMDWRTWDVRDLAGRNAQIRVNDQSILGSIAVDSFTQSDTAKGLPVDASVLGYESLRPQYHYTALSGWLNDANGLLYYQGTWHLCHQHRPPDRSGITWGHATSHDLLHWQRLPEAIQIDDGNGVAASGSGMVDWKNHSGLQRGEHPPLLFFYSEHSHADRGDRINQCLAFSTDAGKTFELFKGNPLLVTPATKDRDPKVFYHEPSQAWIMVLSLSRNNTDREHATYGIFRSPDLKSWELIQELGPGSWFWECPDMYELAIDGDPTNTKWIFQKGSGDYIIGTFDGHHFTAETEPIRTNWNGNFYGAQSFTDAPQGRRVHLAWMSTGKDGPKSWPGMPFNQQMSFPRELTLRTTPEGPRLFCEPVAEITRLYSKTHVVKPRALVPGSNALEGISGDLLDIELELDLQSAQQVILNLRGDPIFYDVKEQRLRTTGRDREFAMLSLKPHSGRLILRVLLDITSIEIFGNHGEVNHARDFFPDPSDHNLSLTVEGGPAQLTKLIVHELKSIWPKAKPLSP